MNMGRSVRPPSAKRGVCDACHFGEGGDGDGEEGEIVFLADLVSCSVDESWRSVFERRRAS